jgi:hypothetical protein
MRKSLAVVVLGIVLGCSSTQTSGGGAPGASGAAPGPTSDPIATGETGDTAAPTEEPPQVDRPPTSWSVGDTSLSTIDGLGLLEAFKKAGLSQDTGVDIALGNGYESLTFSIMKGNAKGRFYVVRPARKETKPSRLASPAETANMSDKDKSAGILDAEADVYFEVHLEAGGKAADAKKILDGVVKNGS